MSERLPVVDDARAGSADGDTPPQGVPIGLLEAPEPFSADAGRPPTGATLREGPTGRERRRRAKHYRSRRHRGALGLLVLVIVAAALAVVLRLFVVQTFWVPSGSMEPTLQVNDRMLVLKVGYTIERGTIVVFRQPPADTADVTHEDLVKRVIGLPGDTIWSVGNTVFIDGKPLAEPWLPKGTRLGQPIGRQVVPRGDYFVMGDNRPDSDDSRYFGPISGRLVIGKVILVFWRGGRPAFHVQ